MDSPAAATPAAEEFAPAPGTDPWPGRHAANRTELDPLVFLRRSATLHPDRTAVVHGGLRRTYEELDARVNRLASALRGRGLERRDRVAVLSPNAPPLLEAHFGVPAAGGVLVAINTRLSAGRDRTHPAHSGARTLLVDAELAALADGLPGRRRRRPHRRHRRARRPLRAAARRRATRPRPARVLADEDEPISINYTSGTTGTPKGVVYTHRGAYLNALGEVVEARLGHAPRYLWTLPMFHCNGWCFPWAVDRRRAARTCACARSTPGEIWQLLREERITHYCGAPTVQIGLVNHPAARRSSSR